MITVRRKENIKNFRKYYSARKPLMIGCNVVTKRQRFMEKKPGIKKLNAMKRQFQRLG